MSTSLLLHALVLLDIALKARAGERGCEILKYLMSCLCSGNSVFLGRVGRNG